MNTKLETIRKQLRADYAPAKEGPAIYVGTYGKYLNGSIEGLWIGLEGLTVEDVYNIAREYHQDEDIEALELDIQDTEHLPKYVESIEAAVEFVEVASGNQFWSVDDLCRIADDLCCDNDQLSRVLENYVGHFDCYEDLGYQMAAEMCLFDGHTETVERYFDFERYGRDLSFDMYESNGHYFWAY